MTHHLRVAALLVAVAILAAGCSGETTPDPGGAASIEGVWVLESFTIDGIESAVEPSVNVPSTPWIEIGTVLSGSTGCNDFGGSPDAYSFTDGVLIPGEIDAQAEGCDSAAEDAFVGVLWGYPDGIEVAITDGGMVWTAGAVQLSFHAADAPPLPPTQALRTAFDRLDCSPGVVAQDDVLDTGQDPEQLVRGASPDVVRVESEPPSFWWGYDQDDQVVAAAALGDIEPVPYSIYTCADAERAVRTFDVDGIEVVVVTETAVLPDRAEVVEFTAMLIDSGSGPELCTGGVADSLPPQCEGPVVVGLDMSGWTEEVGGVRWGERTVIVRWPPVDGFVRLVSDSEPQYGEYVYPPGALPDECAGIEAFVGPKEINDYARSIGERSGGVYLTNDGVIVLQVIDDPKPHRVALAAHGRRACVIRVERSEIELRQIQDRLSLNLSGALQEGWATGSGSGGRIDVNVPVADRNTVEAIAELVENPGSIRVIGQGILLNGE